MSSPRLITVFGATGTQGGSVVDTVLASPELRSKYALRGITRNTSSSHAQALVQKGVEMVSADVNDVKSLETAVDGAYGVFGLTNYVHLPQYAHCPVNRYADALLFLKWDKDVLDKHKEIQQGKNIFTACKAKKVKHFVYSSLPYAAKVSRGLLEHVSHFDSKAIVAEYIETEKEDMMTSYFMPAMYFKSAKDNMSVLNGVITLTMPFEEDGNFAWPFIEPRLDTGKFVVGLFEGGKSADGVQVHGVSTWTNAKEVLKAVRETTGQQTAFRTVSAEVYENSLPKQIAEDMTQTMLLVAGFSYYGPKEEEKQAEHDKWLVRHTTTSSLKTMVEATGPWNF